MTTVADETFRHLSVCDNHVDLRLHIYLNLELEYSPYSRSNIHGRTTDLTVPSCTNKGINIAYT